MKKLFFGMLVAVAALGGSVATYAKTFKYAGDKTERQWFRYNGGPEDEGDSYTITESLPEECGGDDELCAIFALEDTGNPGHPVVDSQTDSEDKDLN
ncbi:hypothetical protein DBR40_07385 [Pedobacter sp. KBW01]|uniref:hypothetical protein n=1 Tax=Pedobacter sp. KBW01 TaxID=2153364 RepID=UPI000F58FF83|nr:hypothetical protein [Pedobacter sp. KBW01]RQO77790.1 hypothetical protein DBR40_07385 [Pedobacter sp. KBW01]